MNTERILRLLGHPFTVLSATTCFVLATVWNTVR
jgi:hypothetical protein